MDGPAALVKTQREFGECSVMCFTETWFHSHLRIPALLYRADRDVERSGKKKGGGIAPLVKEKWRNSQTCSSEGRFP